MQPPRGTERCCAAHLVPQPPQRVFNLPSRFYGKPLAPNAEKTGRAFIDSTLPSDELVQRLTIRLVHGRVPHNARPLTPGTVVGFRWVGRAPNDGGERVFTLRYLQPLQAQRPASSVDLPALRR
jgi:hypothetical protein